jgi:heme A synthase
MALDLLVVHSYFRWLVLLAAVMAVVQMANGYIRNAVYTPTDATTARIFIGLFDLQFLLGLILFGISPKIREAMQDLAGSMTYPHTRFIVAEHPLLMFVALCVAHGASVWARRAPADRVKFQRSALGFAIALGMILVGIPWFRLGGS